MADDKDTQAAASAEKARAVAPEITPAPDKPKPVTPEAAAAPAEALAPSPAVSKALARKARESAAEPQAELAQEPETPAYDQPTATAAFKEQTMTQTSDFAESFQKIASEAQEKAREAFEKSTALFGEYGEYAKGNFEALVESSRILTARVQELGGELITEGRVAVETATTDVKELAGAKSPTEFLKLQGDILRRNVDSAVAYGSKNSEAILKLASDAFQPISGRFSLAMERARSVA